VADEDIRYIEQRWRAAGDPQDGEALWSALHRKHGGIPFMLAMLDDLCRFRRVQSAWEAGRGDNHGYVAALMREPVTLWERLKYLGYTAPKIDPMRTPRAPDSESDAEEFGGFEYCVTRIGDRAQIHRWPTNSSQPHLQTENLYTFACTRLLRISVLEQEGATPLLEVAYLVDNARHYIRSYDGRTWAPPGTSVTFHGRHYGVEHSVDNLSINEWEDTRRAWGTVCNTLATRYKHLRVVQLPRGIGEQDISALLLPYEHHGKHFTLHSLDGHSWERHAITRKHYIAEYDADG
jgi:hypothetical protein